MPFFWRLLLLEDFFDGIIDHEYTVVLCVYIYIYTIHESINIVTQLLLLLNNLSVECHPPAEDRRTNKNRPEGIYLIQKETRRKTAVSYTAAAVPSALSIRRLWLKHTSSRKTRRTYPNPRASCR